VVGGGIGSVIDGAARPGGAVQGELLPSQPARAREGRSRRGCPNRNTQQTRAWILSRFDNPLEGMVALALPADLLQAAEKARAMAQVFRCTVKEALELMLKASQAANPYLNSQMPQDVNLNQRTVTLALGIGAAPAPGAAAGGLAQLRQMMLERAQGATPEGAAVLEGVARDLPEADATNSTT
jgi:hypothetical protein